MAFINENLDGKIAAFSGASGVGKSTLINSLAGSQRAKTGDKPGVTRGKQWVKVNDTIEVMDTPGTLYPKLSKYLEFSPSAAPISKILAPSSKEE